MPMGKLEMLCDIIIEQNMAINSAITRKTINWGMVAAYNEDVVRKIQKLRNKIQNELKAKTKIIEPKAKTNIPVKSRRETEQDDKYEKLVKRMNKYKDDKIRQQMEDEHDGLISRLNR